MTDTKHLSKVDRAGAKRIIQAWKMDGVHNHYDTAYQNERRDPLSHAHYFQHLKTLAPAHRRRLNRHAIKIAKERDAVLEAAI